MTKSNLTAAVAAILMATSPLAYAQVSTTPHETASATATNPTGTDDSDRISFGQAR